MVKKEYIYIHHETGKQMKPGVINIGGNWQSFQLANLVYVDSVSVSEVMGGYEKVDESGIHSFLEDVLGDDLTDEILSRTRRIRGN